MNQTLVSLLLAGLQSAAAPEDTIIVTASRQPAARDDIAVSATVLDRTDIERLNLPIAADLLRLVPGLAIATSGPAGSQTQLRIRGAEANHSLLFVDGIRFNDPAAGNEPRFELLTSDSLSRIEVVRGPQSALWGSEAMGGVVALETADPRGPDRVSALGEYGSHDALRAAGQFSWGGIAGSGVWMHSDGIDSVGQDGERDGFKNGSASLKAVFNPSSKTEVGAVGHWVSGESEFDGFVCDEDFNCVHGNTLDWTRNRIFALRGWAKATFGQDDSWIVSGQASLLDSSNRNYLDDSLLNRTAGRRVTFGAQLSKDLRLGGGRHRLIAAIEHEKEEFQARDTAFGGGTDQDRKRHLTAFVGEWRAEWNEILVTDIAVRHDDFSAFDDATTLRASLLARLGGGWSAHAGYGEGIAQPTFYDLHGFFPDFFVGNPTLRPEHARGWEAGLRWSDARTSVSATGFVTRLRDEIVDIFSFPSTTVNAAGRSRRKGVEIEARHRIGDAGLIAFNYTFLDAEQQVTEGTPASREVRRPRHAANLVGAADIGPLRLGASLAYVGKRIDSDSGQTVTLGDYLLASLSVGWQVAHPLEAYVRLENAFDADYQDVAGYHTAGRTVYAGLRLRLGD